MSARDLLLSGSALRAVLNSALANTRRLESRTRWPGATQFVQGNTFELTVDEYPDVTWETVLTLDLDPGKWLLIGQAVLQPSDFSGYQVLSQLRLDGDLEASAFEAYPFSDTVLLNSNFQIHKPIVLTSGRAVTLDAAHSSSDTLFTPSCDVLQPTIIAYPL